MDIHNNVICPSEFIGFAFVQNGKIQVIFRLDYDTLFVYAEDYGLYCQRMITSYGKTFADIGIPIVVIAESPHTNEFFDTPLQVFNGGEIYCRPTNGTTRGSAGFFIRTQLFDVFTNTETITDNLWHPIIIANACQYQCSAGKPTEAGHRDRNFLTLFWGNITLFNATSLVHRLNLFSSCKIIIACTKGNLSFVRKWLLKYKKHVFVCIHELSLRGCVEHTLMQNGIPFVSVGHPCSWHNPKCRQKRELSPLNRPRKIPKKYA